MRRKDYIEVAEVIRALPYKWDDKRVIAELFALEFQRRDPRFLPNVFLRAVVSSWSGRELCRILDACDEILDAREETMQHA